MQPTFLLTLATLLATTVLPTTALSNKDVVDDASETYTSGTSASVGLSGRSPRPAVGGMKVGADGCFWLGTAPICDPDDCPEGSHHVPGHSLCGDGACCVIGMKKKCCPN